MPPSTIEGDIRNEDVSHEVIMKDVQIPEENWVGVSDAFVVTGAFEFLI